LLWTVHRSGLFIAQGCYPLRAVHRSGLLSARGCSLKQALMQSFNAKKILAETGRLFSNKQVLFHNHQQYH